MQTAYILTRDFFNFALNIKHQENLENLEHIQEQWSEQIERIQLGAKDYALSPDHTEKIVYALAAFSDDLMLRKDNCREDWVSLLLQTKYFNENRAGENFFVHLRNIPRDQNHSTVLSVFYFCLQFGFQGQYIIETDSNTLKEIISKLKQDLFRMGTVQSTSAAVHLKHENESAPSNSNPNKLPKVALGLMAFTLFIYGIFHLHLGTITQTVIEQLNALHGEPQSNASPQGM